jgi:hypothetical protein
MVVMKLERTYEVEEPTRPTTLQDLMSRQSNSAVDMNTDTKPDINSTRIQESPNDGVGVKPSYGFEGIPSLPPKWTYATPEIVRPPCDWIKWR